MSCGMSCFLGACYPRCIVIVISNVICLEEARREAEVESIAEARSESNAEAKAMRTVVVVVV